MHERCSESNAEEAGRGSWTAPLLFGRDTIKPIEEQSYAHLLLAQVLRVCSPLRSCISWT